MERERYFGFWNAEFGFKVYYLFYEKIERNDTIGPKSKTQLLKLGFKPMVSRSGLKTSNRAEGQGVGRRKSAAYMAVCVHFDEVHNTDI